MRIIVFYLFCFFTCASRAAQAITAQHGSLCRYAMARLCSARLTSLLISTKPMQFSISPPLLFDLRQIAQTFHAQKIHQPLQHYSTSGNQVSQGAMSLLHHVRKNNWRNFIASYFAPHFSHTRNCRKDSASRLSGRMTTLRAECAPCGNTFSTVRKGVTRLSRNI